MAHRQRQVKYIVGALIIILTLLNVIPSYTIEVTSLANAGGYEKAATSSF